MFATLHCFYKASFWGVGIHIGPNTPIHLKYFLINTLNIPSHLQDQIWEKVWKVGNLLIKFWFKNDTQDWELSWDFCLWFIVNTKQQKISQKMRVWLLEWWTIHYWSSSFSCGSFDPCASVNIPIFGILQLNV